MEEKTLQQILKERSTQGNIILAVFFTIWFLGSLGGLAYSFNTGLTYLGLILIGQYFFIFGGLGIHMNIQRVKQGKRFDIPVLLLPLVGIVLISVGLMQRFGIPPQLQTALDKAGLTPINVTIYGMLVVFIVVGIGLIVSVILDLKKKVRCSEFIPAVCTDVKTSHQTDSHGHYTTVYCPTWQASYKGQTRNYVDDELYVSKKYHIGDIAEIQINPNNPEEFYSSVNAFKNKVIFVLGIGFVLVPIYAIYMMAKYG